MHDHGRMPGIKKCDMRAVLSTYLLSHGKSVTAFTVKPHGILLPVTEDEYKCEANEVALYMRGGTDEDGAVVFMYTKDGDITRFIENIVSKDVCLRALKMLIPISSASKSHDKLEEELDELNQTLKRMSGRLRAVEETLCEVVKHLNAMNR